MTEVIPLFPLSSVLLPRGRTALQIFEPRYLDLVSHCLKNESGFGVVLLREGSEVMSKDHPVDTRLSSIGSFAKIVDWDSLPNGLLGVTIEGQKKFTVLSSYQEKDGLHKAEVEWIAPEPMIALPEDSDDMQLILRQLLQHPHLERLQLDTDVNDVSSLSFLLTQLIPIDERLKFELLSLTEPMVRLHQIMDVLDQFSQ